MDDRSQPTWEVPEDEGDTACSGFSPVRQCISLSTEEQNSSSEYRFRIHVSHSHDLLESFEQSARIILTLTVIQSFVFLSHETASFKK